MVRRRWFFQIMRDMLAVGSGTRADLMYVARVNSTQLKRYLDFLVNNGLMEERKHGRANRLYHVTPEGKKALGKLQEIIDLLGVDKGLDTQAHTAARLWRLTKV